MKYKYKYPSLIFIAALTSLMLIFLFLHLIFNLRSEARKQAEDIAKLTVSETIKSVELYFRDAYTLGSTISNNLLALQENDIDRYKAYDFIKHSIKSNPQFLAIWTMWEPNAFDNKDSLFANKYLHDNNGTFSIAYYYDGDTVKSEINEVSDFQEDFFAVPKKLRQPLIIDPFYYQYHGNKRVYFEASLVIPIMVNDSFLGVIGIDINLFDLQQKLKNKRIYSNGFISLISNAGKIVTHKDSSFIDKDISAYLQADVTNVIEGNYSGLKVIETEKTAYSNVNSTHYFAPVSLNYMTKPWYIMAEVPTDAIYNRMKNIGYLSALVLLLSLSMIFYFIWNFNFQRKIENQLRKNEHDLIIHKDNLELLVSERTYEIETLNEELRTSNEELTSVNEVLVDERNRLEEALTELKNAQFHLVQSEKMVSIGLLTAGIAHEINNPISFISVAAQGLKNVMPTFKEFAILLEELSPENCRDVLQKISEIKQKQNFSNTISLLEPVVESIFTGVQRTTEIIDSLKQFSRNDSKPSMDVDLNRIIDSALLLLKNRYKNEVVIFKEIPNNMLVFCIEGQLMQVIVNLLNNAIDSVIEKYENPEKRRINIKVDSDEQVVKIVIGDNGIGIPASLKDQVFNPFYTTKPSGKGTGLGLSISMNIIQKHNGQMSLIENNMGGVDFIILLPK